jgi:hypothetical protein
MPGAAAAEAAFGAPGAGAGPGFGGVLGASGDVFPMLGDLSPRIGAFQTNPPGPPRPIGPPKPNAKSLFPGNIRLTKIADNQSPVPQDRVYFYFNYFDNVNKALNTRFEAPIRGVQAYTYTWGFEKTFNNGFGSFGMRLPLDNVFALSTRPKLNAGGDSTALGDLTIFLKHVFYVDPASGSLASGGLAITPLTAPRHFGGASFLPPGNTTTLQPFFGLYLKWDRVYLQGFSAFDFPIDYLQPTFMFNDLGLGYFVYIDPTMESLISAVAPTVEAHVNTPLNHRGPYNLRDKFGTADVVDITAGLNVRILDRAAMTFGAVTPTTGPKPFHIEATALLNIYFGRSRRPAAALPMIGG